MARFKASLFDDGLLVDITAGLGVDSVHFSESFQHIVIFEKDPILAAFNELLGVRNMVVYAEHGRGFRTHINQRPDLIYVDPDRRVGDNGKQILLQNYEPDLTQIKGEILETCNRMLVKLSPMVDLTYVKQTLPEASAIWVISEKNEVKEVLVLLKKTPPILKLPLSTWALLSLCHLSLSGICTTGTTNSANRFCS